MNAPKLAFVVAGWGNVLYLLASIGFLLVKDDLTGYLTAAFYLAGSFMYALSDFIRISCSSGFNRAMNISFSIADSTLTIGSIFFFPPLGIGIVGNWFFEIAGWANLFNHSIKFHQLYREPSPTWKIELLARIFTVIGVIMFIVGNIVIINNTAYYFYTGFILFTTGSIGFVIGGSFPIGLEADSRKIQEINERSHTQDNVKEMS